MHRSDDVAVGILYHGNQLAPAELALVDGAAGAGWAPGGQPRVVFGFTIKGGKIVAIDLLADPERLRQLDLTVLED